MNKLARNSQHVGGEFILSPLARNSHLQPSEFIMTSLARKSPTGIRGLARYVSRPPGSAVACAPPINRCIPFWVHLNIGGTHISKNSAGKKRPPRRRKGAVCPVI